MTGGGSSRVRRMTASCSRAWWGARPWACGATCAPWRVSDASNRRDRSCVPHGQRLACAPVNAAVSLIGRVLPATVHVQAEIPSEHPSARLLGTERMGSGAIIDPAGLILTVNYVVLGAAEARVPLLHPREAGA